ncbi:leucine-rich repeat and IQ domain-containing protein 3 isoform X2 [Nematostella vectensis]|nr:leucine-rich repeat and IQ domain-containing protein 3 isoform X2 [Nematostella vectensis]
MASSPSLSILTLYDTPLSLKPSYRHHVVNSLWSLKVLDRHVISDEEIIEDATFSGRFSALRPSFLIDLKAPFKKEHNYDEALNHVNKLISQVNHIQAKNSPVLIIQKLIRGHLARQRVKYLQDMRIWAAVSIQRFYRHYKGHGRVEPFAPPSSPAPSRSSSAVIRLDYDSYVKDIKPGYQSRVTPKSSEEKLKSKSPSKSVSIVVEPIDRIYEEEEGSRVSNTPTEEKLASDDGSPVRVTTRVSINLLRLETSTSDIIKAQKEAVKVERELGLEPKKSKMAVKISKTKTVSTLSAKEKPQTKSKELLKEEERIWNRTKRRKRKDRVVRYPTVRVFFGPIAETHPRTEKVFENSEEAPRAQFRLSGLDPPINTTEPLLEMLASKREAGIEVRKAAREHELNVLNEPRKVIIPRPTMNIDQRLFMRTHGTMGIACLRAVQQAYRDRERAESASSKSEKVAQLREERLQSRERVQAFKTDYQETTLRRRLREEVKTAEVLKEREARRVAEQERLQTARAVTAEQKKSRQADRMFMNDFSCQQTSVSNALLKHDRVAHKDETILLSEDVVRKGKELSQENQSLVKRYMEHRQLLRQAETAMARADLDARMLQEATQRVTQAKSRVSHLKSRQKEAQEFYALPPTNAPAPLPPLAVVSPDQEEVWRRLPRFHWAPRSHERAQTEPANTGERSSRVSRMYSFEPEFGLV